ncbi:uncharacterized protein LOC123683872 [Harmonia axyridis]|uniref:uncharacterized protein LOC123683872 n=1 Tax=Harmonia axyridis TaxID=115357 RepID=UPI001E27862B|nr:uncharacterized protein LOC123683872 [Harmonia axyridis]
MRFEWTKRQKKKYNQIQTASARVLLCPVDLQPPTLCYSNQTEEEKKPTTSWISIGYMRQLNVESWSTPKVTPWLAIWSGGVIVPYFFKNEEDVTQNRQFLCYSKMITDFFGLKFMVWNGSSKIVQHLAILQEKFPEHEISPFGDVNWPPRSCDLSTLNFFWGLLSVKLLIKLLLEMCQQVIL